jgi:predicted CoA-binding protein
MITGRIEVVWEELRVYREEERSKRRERKRKVAVDECGQRPV